MHVHSKSTESFSKGSSTVNACLYIVIATWESLSRPAIEVALGPFVVPNIDLSALLNFGDMLRVENCSCRGASINSSRNGSNTSLVITTENALGLVAMKDFAAGEFVCTIDNVHMRTHEHEFPFDVTSMRTLFPPSEIFQKLLGGLASQCSDPELSNVSVFNSGEIGRQGFQLDPHFFIASNRPISTGCLVMNSTVALECLMWTNEHNRYYYQKYKIRTHNLRRSTVLSHRQWLFQASIQTSMPLDTRIRRHRQRRWGSTINHHLLQQRWMRLRLIPKMMRDVGLNERQWPRIQRASVLLFKDDKACLLFNSVCS